MMHIDRLRWLCALALLIPIAGCTGEVSIEGDPEILTNPDRASAKLVLRLGNDAAKAGNWGRAIENYTEAIRLNPHYAMAYSNRGHCFSVQRQYEKAVADLNKAIELDPNLPIAYGNRALAWINRQKYGRAVEDLTVLLEMRPDDAAVYYQRGGAWYHLGHLEEAMADFEKAAELKSDFARAHNDLAWVLATSPNADQRDGERAVAHATRACKLTDAKDWSCLSTMAASLAENGQWELAVRFQKEAIRLAGGDDAERMSERLQLYESERPYRESKDRPQTTDVRSDRAQGELPDAEA